MITEVDNQAQVHQSIFMACPAGREFFKVVGLFLQELRLHLGHSQSIGRRGITVNDLEMLKAQFDYNNVDEEDTAYIRKVARRMGLCWL